MYCSYRLFTGLYLWLQKESDLELAARIGQGLLEKNKSLQTKNEHLEELLAESNEKVRQYSKIEGDKCGKD